MEADEQQLQPQRLGGGVSAMKTTCPPWLQAAIADIEQRVRSLSVESSTATEQQQHSFAERAENYYEKRPQLLALLTDLHHRYLYLADRYSQSLLLKTANLHKGSNSCCCSSDSDSHSDVVLLDDRSSDAGSSLSFQFQQQPPFISDAAAADSSLIVAELVAAWVDRDILADEAERRRTEAARKIELQGSLVEVLESERLVLLAENARLGFRASAAAAELGYMRRRAAEMARLVVKLREDHRVCMMGRKIEALQAQVYGLELRNRECYDTLAAWEAERKVAAAELDRLRTDNRRLVAAMQQQARPPATGKKKKKKNNNNKLGWWWSRVRLAAEWSPCAPPSVRDHQMKKSNYPGPGGCFCV